MQKIRRKEWRRRLQQGFTLMELLIVIAIVGIISAIAAPAIFNIHDRYQLRASATEVLSAFKKAQSEAVKRNTRVGITMNTGTGVCTVFVDDGGTLGVGANNIKQDSTEQTVYSTTAQTGISLANDGTSPFPLVPLGSGNPSMEYSSAGFPINTGILIISGSATIGVTYRINLTSTAGHVSLQVSTDNGTTWK